MILETGQSASLSRTVSEEDVVLFASITGDENPLHVDEEFAKQSRFGKKIVHGMLSASLISAVIGMKLPGHGAIYLSQSLRFESPVFVGSTITATVTIVQVRNDKPIVTLETVCRDQDGKCVVRGEAVVLVADTK